MRSRLRRVSPAVVLLVLAVLAAAVAVAADHVSWPMATAFPWLHGAGKYAYVATKTQFELSWTANVVARFAAVLTVLLLVAAVVVAVVRRRHPGRTD